MEGGDKLGGVKLTDTESPFPGVKASAQFGRITPEKVGELVGTSVGELVGAGTGALEGPRVGDMVGATVFSSQSAKAVVCETASDTPVKVA